MGSEVKNQRELKNYQLTAAKIPDIKPGYLVLHINHAENFHAILLGVIQT
jgi:hypothetical protein